MNRISRAHAGTRGQRDRSQWRLAAARQAEKSTAPIAPLKDVTEQKAMENPDWRAAGPGKDFELHPDQYLPRVILFGPCQFGKGLTGIKKGPGFPGFYPRFAK